jgi:hypothetical protein
VSLSDVTILITAGGRPGYLRECLYGIERNLPECKVNVVTDDYSEIFYQYMVIWYPTPPDTFLTRKRNLGVASVDTKYTLLAADDFEFDPQSRATVISMTKYLDQVPEMDVIAGPVNNRPYAGYLHVEPGEYIKETRVRLDCRDKDNSYSVNIAANFFLARTDVLREVKWDETIGPIGGEHGDWFLDMMNADKFVSWSPLLNINEQPKDRTKESPDYRERRARAHIGHELMLKKRGVKHYYGFDEEVK